MSGEGVRGPGDRRRVAVGVSGSGRSLANFLRLNRRDAPFSVVAVIASRPDCYAVEIAHQHALPVFVGDFSRRSGAETEARLYSWLATHDVGWVALAGFIRLFPVPLAWQQRVVNIHPALLPHFGGQGMYGDRVHAAVLAAGATTSGATVHFVNEHYDDGAVIAQIQVPVLPEDDTHSLADRVFAAECQLYPETLRRLVEGDLPRPDRGIERFTYGES